MRRLVAPQAALLLLLAAAVLPATAGAEQVAAGPLVLPSRLALLFNANVSSACAGRCSLQATAAACAGRLPAAAVTSERQLLAADAASAAQAELQRGWNSVVLSWQESARLQATVQVHCHDPACTPSPPSFVALRGAECGGGGEGEGSAEAALLAEPLGSPAPANGSSSADKGSLSQHQVFMLNSRRPAVAVQFAPLQPAAALPSAPLTDAAAAVGERQGANSEHGNLAADEGETAPQGDEEVLAEVPVQRHACGGREWWCWVLRAALVAWTFGCGVLAAAL